MSKKLITEIEIEHCETLIIRQPRHDTRPLCQRCGGATMISPEEVAAIAGISLRTVFRLIEAGAIHFQETPGGAIYVCALTLTRETLNALTTIRLEEL